MAVIYIKTYEPKKGCRWNTARLWLLLWQKCCLSIGPVAGRCAWRCYAFEYQKPRFNDFRWYNGKTVVEIKHLDDQLYCKCRWPLHLSDKSNKTRSALNNMFSIIWKNGLYIVIQIKGQLEKGTERVLLQKPQRSHRLVFKSGIQDLFHPQWMAPLLRFVLVFPYMLESSFSARVIFFPPFFANSTRSQCIVDNLH